MHPLTVQRVHCIKISVFSQLWRLDSNPYHDFLSRTKLLAPYPLALLCDTCYTLIWHFRIQCSNNSTAFQERRNAIDLFPRTYKPQNPAPWHQIENVEARWVRSFDVKKVGWKSLFYVVFGYICFRGIRWKCSICVRGNISKHFQEIHENWRMRRNVVRCFAYVEIW